MICNFAVYLVLLTCLEVWNMRENVFCMVFYVRWISHHSSPNPPPPPRRKRLGRDSETRGEKNPSHMEKHAKCISCKCLYIVFLNTLTIIIIQCTNKTSIEIMPNLATPSSVWELEHKIYIYIYITQSNVQTCMSSRPHLHGSSALALVISGHYLHYFMWNVDINWNWVKLNIAQNHFISM